MKSETAKIQLTFIVSFNTNLIDVNPQLCKVHVGKRMSRITQEKNDFATVIGRYSVKVGV